MTEGNESLVCSGGHKKLDVYNTFSTNPIETINTEYPVSDFHISPRNEFMFVAGKNSSK